MPTNPDWTRDEVILALDLFVSAGCLGGGPIPGKTDARTVALSDELNRLSIFPAAERTHEFRNVTGVSLKLANLRAIDRDLAIERGDRAAADMPKGMARYSALDRTTFEEFVGAWQRLPEEAALVRSERRAAPAAERPRFAVCAVEESTMEFFDAADSTGGERRRREAGLVRAYQVWMEARGLAVERHRYAVEGEARSLVCDAYVPDLRLLIEAKADASRLSLRMAIGQLMDYRRFLDDPVLAVLLPHPPSFDHADLLRSVGVGWIWPGRSGSFCDTADGAFTGARRGP